MTHAAATPPKPPGTIPLPLHLINVSLKPATPSHAINIMIQELIRTITNTNMLYSEVITNAIETISYILNELKKLSLDIRGSNGLENLFNQHYVLGELGNTLLGFAARRGQAAIVKCLVTEAKADPNVLRVDIENKEDKVSPLAMAIQGVTEIVDNGTEEKLSSEFKTERLKTIEILLENGADPDFIMPKKHERGSPTPLLIHALTESRRWPEFPYEIAVRLLTFNAKINARCLEQPQTPLVAALATYNAEYPEVYFNLISLLLNNGADVNAFANRREDIDGCGCENTNVLAALCYQATTRRNLMQDSGEREKQVHPIFLRLTVLFLKKSAQINLGNKEQFIKMIMMSDQANPDLLECRQALYTFEESRLPISMPPMPSRKTHLMQIFRQFSSEVKLETDTKETSVDKGKQLYNMLITDDPVKSFDEDITTVLLLCLNDCLRSQLLYCMASVLPSSLRDNMSIIGEYDTPLQRLGLLTQQNFAVILKKEIVKLKAMELEDSKKNSVKNANTQLIKIG